MPVLYTVIIRGFFVVVGLTLTLASLAAEAPTVPTVDTSAGEEAISTDVLVAMANESRATADMPPLEPSAKLAAAAQAKLADMVAKQYFGHRDAEGRGVWGTIKSMSYQYRHAGENLAKGWKSSDELQAAWMASPKHCANIMDPRYTDIGIATAEVEMDGVRQTLTVELFGTTKQGSMTGPALTEAITRACGA
jgi:uncharacterized protein YkwD